MRRVLATSAGVVRLSLAAAFVAATSVSGFAQTTVTLNQPSQVVYATLRGGTYANTNLSTTLETRRGSTLSYERRAIVKFDTQNTIPAGSSVTSAILTMTVKDATAGQTRHVAAYQMTTSWAENEATWNVRRTSTKWNTSGGDLGTKLATATVGYAANSKVSFDVTALVKEAVSGKLGSSRYTRVELVDLDAPTNQSYRAYYTPGDVNASYRPTLVVKYGSSSSGSTTTTNASTGSSSGTTTTSTSKTLRVLQYNVHHNGIGTDGVYDPNRIATWIAKINPDVVSLVEVEAQDSYYSGDGAALYKSLLQSKTGKTWYTLSIQDYGDWSSAGIRNVILSKIPFISTYRHEFSIGRDRTIGGVTISVNGRTINVMSTHLDPYSESNRITQAKELVPYASGEAEDRIVLGDFNALPTTSEMSTIKAAYYDGWAEAVKLGVQQSAPDNPNGYTRKARIDYVFYSHGEKHLTLKSVQVVDTRNSSGIMPSDHRPLVATFAVN